jgi:hypothetical protein
MRPGAAIGNVATERLRRARREAQLWSARDRGRAASAPAILPSHAHEGTARLVA